MNPGTSTLLATQVPAAPQNAHAAGGLCAGSLILPFADLETAFEAQNPDVDVLGEYHGSIQVMRHVTDIHEKIDVVATADHSLIPMLMYATPDPDTGLPYASWYIRFAGNRLALAYTSRSKFADEINAQNWYEVITRPGVRLGIADPRFDASGYRALMALKLAESFYGKPGLLNGVIKDQFEYPITVFEDDSGTEITVPEILRDRYRFWNCDPRRQHRAAGLARIGRPGLCLRIRKRHPAARPADGRPPGCDQSGLCRINLRTTATW